jgi:streptomycin 6-kinase
VNLPAAFVQNVNLAFGEAGQRFLADLPDLLAAAARRWDLILGESFLLSYNFVCVATRKEGTPAVLKIGVPNRELTSEIAALRLYDGEGACRLYAADAEAGMLLEERLLPGILLHQSTLDDEAQTAIAADVMRRLWRAAPPGEAFISLRSWFDELAGLRPRFGGGTGPFPSRLVEAVESLLPDLFASGGPDVVLHGDCHHFNILLSDRGWLAIDPKGVIGPPEYEPAALMLNPWGNLAARPNASAISRRRLDILAERLDLDRSRLWAWAVCHCLLSAWWDLNENDTGGTYSAACGEMLLALEP